MRIGIDARFLTHPQPGGFKTYTESLVAALASVDQENEYILYLDRSPDGQALLPNRPNFSYRVLPGKMPLLGMPLREQARLPFQAYKDRLDILHSPCLTAPMNLSCASVVTIHDTIWLSQAAPRRQNHTPYQRKLMAWYYRYVPERAAHKAQVVITVSHAARKEIIRRIGVPAELITVTYEAANPQFRRIEEKEAFHAIRSKYALPHKFILAIGSADPRKNIRGLIHAYGLLPEKIRAEFGLVIVWNHPALANELAQLVARLKLDEQVHFLQHVSTDDLVLLYNTASLFVFPSLSEGFGLPPLEAMACGLPVVAAANSSIPEILGDAAFLVNNLSREDGSQQLCTAMSYMLSNPLVLCSYALRGAERARYFSWERCARETISVYQLARQYRNKGDRTRA